jgi:type III secretion system low calcium response chaperone LcrH/SycD
MACHKEFTVVEIPDLDDENTISEFIDYLKKGGTLQKMYQMTDSDIEMMFVAASRYMGRQEYEDAADAYLFLTFLNPYRTDFWIGLGEASRLSEQLDRAIDAYQMASHYDAEDPRPYFHAGSCMIRKESYGEALHQMMLAVEHCQGKDEFGSMREVAHELIDDLKERMGDD